MRRISIRCLALLLCLIAVASPAIAASNDTTQISFRADGIEYVVELPTGYLAYTAEMGKKSPLLIRTGVSVEEMDEYMNLGDFSLCAVHRSLKHMLWISVKDRKLLASSKQDSVSMVTQREFHDGYSLLRGKYKEYQSGGTTYFVFENNPSIDEDGLSCYISFFINRYNVSLRWESGNGKMREQDIEKLLGIAMSIRKK